MRACNVTHSNTKQFSAARSLEWRFYPLLHTTHSPFQPALHPFLQIPGDARPLLAASILSSRRLVSRSFQRHCARVAIVPTGAHGILALAARVSSRDANARSSSTHVSRCGPLRAPARGGASSSDVPMATRFNSFENVRFMRVCIRFD